MGANISLPAPELPELPELPPPPQLPPLPPQLAFLDKFLDKLNCAKSRSDDYADPRMMKSTEHWRRFPADEASEDAAEEDGNAK